MRLLTLLTDFGDRDGFTGAVKGVIAGIAPAVRVVDIAHGVPRGDVLHAAWVLRSVCRYYPSGTVHVVVVDPGVGSGRKALAVRTSEQFFVAPDNGVLAWVVREAAGAGASMEAWSVEDGRFLLSPPSATFHGRDVFAPAGAFLARGVDPSELGPPLDARLAPEGDLSGGPVVEMLPRPGASPREGRVIHIDRFGNCITTLPAGDLPASVRAGEGTFLVEGREGTTAEVPGLLPSYTAVDREDPLALAGSTGLVEIAVNGGDAAARFDLVRGSRVRAGTDKQPR
ncbi:MAG: SAM-dependent chlorinase/fluorinase [bacterium]